MKTKRLLSVLLALFMALALLPALAFTSHAAPTAPGDYCEIVETGEGYATLNAALPDVLDGQTIILLVDIPRRSALDINNGKAFTIDMDGFELDLGTNDLTVRAGNELTVKGCGGLVGLKKIEVAGKAVFKGALAYSDVLSATGGGEVIVDGTITTLPPAYISVGGIAKAVGDYAAATTKQGYFTYTDGTSTVWVKGTAPTINGPTTLSLANNYAATATEAYTVTGAGVTVTKTSGDAAITWDNSAKVLKIAAGLAAGDYPVVLKASNGAGDATVTFTLTVAPPVAPAITAQPQNRSITIGQGTTFSVTATGIPTPTYQWQWIAPLGNWQDLNASTMCSGVTTATLTLTNVGADYNGYQFRCVVTNSAGSKTSNVATLSVASAVKTIFSTRYVSNFWNWFKFIVLFGWVWMWFI